MCAEAVFCMPCRLDVLAGEWYDLVEPNEPDIDENWRKLPVEKACHASAEYSREKNLEEQMNAVVALYRAGGSLQEIGRALSLNPLKVRKLLITAGVYASDKTARVNEAFAVYRKTQTYAEAVLSTAAALGLSKAAVTAYLPYTKGVYFSARADAEKISPAAQRQRRYRVVKRLQESPTEELLWQTVLAYAGVQFKTISGLPFSYEIRRGRNGQYTRELWIDRRESSKSLTWSSVLRAFDRVRGRRLKVDRPKALGDIRGVTYIYAMFLRFGLIEGPNG